MDTKEITGLYKSLVEEELKLRATVDDDGDVQFQSDEYGMMFFSLDAETDPEYMMLVFPNFADTETLKLTPEQLMRAVNSVNGISKGAKLFIPDMSEQSTLDVTATIESFLAEPGKAPDRALLRATIRRNISALLDSARTLFMEAERIKGHPVPEFAALAEAHP